MTFHDLRATGITWCAVRGDDALKIKQRAGHKSFSTTEGYIREAENLRDAFGEVFPALPQGLLGSLGSVSVSASPGGLAQPKTSMREWRRRESNSRRGSISNVAMPLFFRRLELRFPVLAPPLTLLVSPSESTRIDRVLGDGFGDGTACGASWDPGWSLRRPQCVELAMLSSGVERWP